MNNNNGNHVRETVVIQSSSFLLDKALQLLEVFYIEVIASFSFVAFSRMSLLVSCILTHMNNESVEKRNNECAS